MDDFCSKIDSRKQQDHSHEFKGKNHVIWDDAESEPRFTDNFYPQLRIAETAPRSAWSRIRTLNHMMPMDRNHPRPPSPNLLLLTVGFCSAVAVGQDALRPLVITASRTPQDPLGIPYSVSTLDRSFLEDNQMRTLPESLRYTPGVLIQKTAHGHGSPFIRGFTGRQNLLLVDGIRTNNSTWRGGPVQYWNTVDSRAVDHIELIRSQGSVLYGSDAAGGTVNVLTRNPIFQSGSNGELYQTGSAYYEYRSNGEGSHIGRVESEVGVGKNFGILLGATLKDYGDLSDSAVGRMKGTGYPEQDYDLKAQWAVTPDSTLTFAHMYVNQDRISRWHRTLDNPGWSHNGHVAAPGSYTSNLYDQERSLSYIRYEGENPMEEGWIRRWQTTLSYQTTRDSESQNRNPGKDDIRFQDIDLSTLGFDLQMESDIGPGSLLYGLDYYHDDVDSSGLRTDSARTFLTESLPVADDSKYDLLGAYAQYSWNPLQPLQISTGTRYTYARAKLGRYYDSTNTLQGSTSESWDALVGSIRSSWKFNDEWSSFAGISQAFRAPNLDDLSGNQTSKSGIASLGNVDLDPERYITYEAGIRHLTDHTSLQASFFFTDVSDLITGIGFDQNADGIPDGSIAANASDAYSSGFEIEGAWAFARQWMLSGFVAWQEGRQQSATLIGGPVSSLPSTRSYPLTGSLAVRWTHESEKFWLEGRILAASQEDRITMADQAADNQRIPTGGTPGYTVGALRAGWQCRENLELTAALENVTDQDHRVHGSGQNEPGFNAIIGARLTW